MEKGSKFILLVTISISLQTSSWAASFGVNYGRLGDNLPPPDQVHSLLELNNIKQVRIFDSSSDVLQTFANKYNSFNISVSISVTNEQLQSVASSISAAQSWIDSNYSPYVAAGLSIPVIAIGNEVLVKNTQISQFLLPAMNNIKTALATMPDGGASTVVSTPHAFSVLSASSFPPSNGRFDASIAESSMRPILNFLSMSNSPFMINVYPFFSFNGDPTDVPLDYATFGTTAVGVTDGAVHYSNLFDAMVDTVVTALSTMGYGSMPIVVTESGWPSAGDEVGATIANAQSYTNGLISHLASGVGTPLRPGVTPETYVFALFNEDQKTGPTSERNFGLFQPNQAPVYDIKIS